MGITLLTERRKLYQSPFHLIIYQNMSALGYRLTASEKSDAGKDILVSRYWSF